MGSVFSLLCDGSAKLEDENEMDRLVYSTTKPYTFRFDVKQKLMEYVKLTLVVV